MDKEKRSEFRILGKGRVLVCPLKQAPSDEDSPKSAFMSDEMRDFSSAYEELCERTAEAIGLHGQMPDGIGGVIHLLNEKVDLVTQQLTLTRLAKNEPIQPINIGAGGARFITDKSIEEGAYMALCMALLPGPQNVYTFAQCTRSDPLLDTPGERHSIAVQFLSLGSNESQTIRRYIMQSERQKLRKASA